MAVPRGAVRVDLPLPAGPLALYRPQLPEALRAGREYLDPDEQLPFWAEPWPSGLALAAELDSGRIDVAGRTVLELGCGLGVVGITAARAGAASVTMTDIDPQALRFAAASARLNGVRARVQRLDWRAPPDDMAVDTVFCADVLYDHRLPAALAHAIDRCTAPSATVWLADPGRGHLPALRASLTGWIEDHDRASPTALKGVDSTSTVRLCRFRRSALL